MFATFLFVCHNTLAQGLKSMYDVPIFGRVCVFQLFRPKGEAQDLLLIVTEKRHMCILAFDLVEKQIVTRASGTVQDRIGNPRDRDMLAAVDVDCNVILLHMYDGLLKLFPLTASSHVSSSSSSSSNSKNQVKFGEAFNVRLEDLEVIDLVFLCPNNNRPTIAYLYQDHHNARHIKVNLLA